MDTKISIHMCTYNRAHFIEQAINSVLAQTFTSWELLILDDASTDNTEEIIAPYLKDPRIKYIKNETNLGITKNRNKALSLSTGEYIAVLDSDDYWTNTEKLYHQVIFLDQHQDHALVGTDMIMVNEHGIKIKKISYFRINLMIKFFLLVKNFFCHSSVMYRRNVAEKLGGYDESLAIWEDYDLWLKIGITYKLANLHMFGTAYRVHGNQSNTHKEIGLKAQEQIISKYKKHYPNFLLAKMVHHLRAHR